MASVKRHSLYNMSSDILKTYCIYRHCLHFMALIFRGEFQILYFVYAAFNLEMKRIYFALNILT